jgi:hypothetical protein
MKIEDKFTELKTTANARSSHTSALATQRYATPKRSYMRLHAAARTRSSILVSVSDKNLFPAL